MTTTKTTTQNRMTKWLMMLVLFTATSLSHAEIRLCTFDPAGDFSSILRDYVIFANQNGYDIDYTNSGDEEAVVAQFDRGECDAIMITGVRARKYNNFSGSIDSINGLRSYDQMRTALKLLSGPKADRYLSGNKLSIAGILPAGNVYLWSRDLSKGMNVDQLAGQTMVMIKHDETQALAASTIGMKTIPSDLNNYARYFVNGDADIIVAPAVAYEALGIKKGVGTKGGRLDFVIAELSYQLVVRNGIFGDEFVNQSREFFYKKWSVAKRVLDRLESRLPANQVFRLTPEELNRYEVLSLQIQKELIQRGYYNNNMMRLLKKIRCRYTPNLLECQ